MILCYRNNQVNSRKGTCRDRMCRVRGVQKPFFPPDVGTICTCTKRSCRREGVDVLISCSNSCILSWLFQTCNDDYFIVICFTEGKHGRYGPQVFTRLSNRVLGLHFLTWLWRNCKSCPDMATPERMFFFLYFLGSLYFCSFLYDSSDGANCSVVCSLKWNEVLTVREISLKFLGKKKKKKI